MSCPPPVQRKTRCLWLSNWVVLLLDVVINIAVVSYSRHLKTQRINVTFDLNGMRQSPICLNMSMFAQIIRDPASSTEEVTIRFFLWIFNVPNNVLVSKFGGWSLQSARHSMEERGGVSRVISIKATLPKKRLSENRADREKYIFVTLPLRNF